MKSSLRAWNSAWVSVQLLVGAQSKLETGPGAHHLEQVGDETLELTRTVNLAHRWPVRCNAKLERGMQGQPIQLALVEDNLARAMSQFIVDYAPVSRMRRQSSRGMSLSASSSSSSSP